MGEGPTGGEEVPVLDMIIGCRMPQTVDKQNFQVLLRLILVCIVDTEATRDFPSHAPFRYSYEMDSFAGSFPYIPPRSGTTDIGLVKLLLGAVADVIRSKPEYVNLVSEFDFQTISYIWDDANETVPIELDGYKFPVTVNLESTLRHLRRR